MTYKELRQQIDDVQSHVTPTFIENAVRTLSRQGEDPGGGINAFRLVTHLLGNPQLSDVELVWVYDQLKPVLRDAVEQAPALYFFEGD